MTKYKYMENMRSTAAEEATVVFGCFCNLQVKTQFQFKNRINKK